MRLTRSLTGGVAATLVSAVLLAAAPAARAEDLTVFDWSGYEDPSNHPAYTAKYGSEPDFTFFGDEEEAFQKLRSGFSADLAHPCSQSVARWRDAGVIEPLDTLKLTFWNDIEPDLKAMKNLMTTADGKAWFLPFEWGNSLVLYRSDKVKPEDILSLKALADPKFEGRVSIGDNVDDAYALASLAIGLKDWTQMTDAQFTEASDFLRALHKNVRMYWTENTDLSQALASGEVDVAWGWNETATSLKAGGQPVEMLKNADVGVSTWVCGYVRLKGATADEAHQYDFLNAVSDPAVAKYLVEAWGYGHGNAKGMAAVGADVLKAKGYDNIDGFLKNTLFQQPLPTELRQKMIAEFEKIKAGY